MTGAAIRIAHEDAGSNTLLSEALPASSRASKLPRPSARIRSGLVHSDAPDAEQASARRAWERTCSRKLYSGRYIFSGCSGPFANKFAHGLRPESEADLYIAMHRAQSRLLPAGRGCDRGGDPHCSRRRWFKHPIIRGSTGLFASKLAPTKFAYEVCI
ncbi:hypothetical protein ALP32_200402 [Pseudomonas avellanae]|uniref:Uncharacterized protein n=1 Tax=Pseudomonas avellanae TaxID=46257 RepID=A0A3M5SYQ7_9PSED|nr:hypothetical protein ALP32_200402 [Pseudomonas avellanae]